MEGVGEEGPFTENCPKMLFFLGNSMTIKFGNFAIFIVRNIVVVWEAPIEGFSTLLSSRFQEGFLEGVLQCALQGGRVLRRALRRGSKKGL